MYSGAQENVVADNDLGGYANIFIQEARRCATRFRPPQLRPRELTDLVAAAGRWELGDH